MRCKFCFATFQDVKQTVLPKGHLPKEQAIEVVLQLAEIGFEKITFAGGEPTLCPWLPELITTAKEAGMTTMIVTNGSKLTDTFLEANKRTLDWIAVSIDSLNIDTNFSTGRAIAGNTPLTLDYYLSLVDRIKQHGYGLKINTVVSSKNYTEQMNEIIRYSKPKRWKLLQVLPIIGQNDLDIVNFKISDEQFKLFLDNHNDLKDITNIVPESNSQMKGSYAMVDPAGRFYDNRTGKHNYSRPILEIGSRLAIQQVNYDFSKFVQRGGIYDWQIRKNVSDMNFTISGEVASGKSTVGKALAAKLGYSFMSIGEKIREVAAENGMSIVEYQKLCSENPQLDLDFDARFAEDCNKRRQTVFDYRLGFKFVHDSFHVFLKIRNETAKIRLQNADRHNETAETLEERNELFRKQFLTCYDIDYCDERHYDLVVNVEEFSSADEIVNFIINKLNIHRSEN